MKRVVILIAMAVVGVMLWNQWQIEQSAHPHGNATVTTTTQNNSASGGFVPTATTSMTPASHTVTGAVPTVKATTNVVTVATDVLNVTINKRGGDIIASNLPKYPVSLQTPKQAMPILSSAPGDYYVVQTGISNVAKQNKIPLYSSSQRQYRLASGEQALAVTLTAQEGALQISKTYHFSRGKYQVQVDTKIKNISSQPWSGRFYYQIARQEPEHHFGSMAYNGAAISSPEVPYHKLKYKSLLETPVQQTITGGWIAMQQHYFLSAWIPPAHQMQQYYSQVQFDNHIGANVYYLGYSSPLQNLKAGQSTSHSSRLYVGPEDLSRLASIAPGLKLTVDYGILSPISLLIFSVMKSIYHFVGNWGWTIILITILIKLLLYWPSAMSYRSMARMKALAPRLKSLQERYADDKQALSKATMALYKTEKVNPVGGCLPMIVQIPIFIALYWVLIESVQLRQAPFIFWIHDLSVKDPYYILPVIMGASMFLQQKLSPAPADASMAKMQLIMPIVFTIFFMHFPSGLVLYWLTNNLVSVAQQAYILKTYDAAKADRELRRKKKRKR